MLLNKYETKHKEFIKDQKRLDKLRYITRTMDYVPLEKPEFMGWEVSIGLTDSGGRRRDAPDLQYVLNILGISKWRFTRYVKYIKHLRNLSYSIDKATLYSWHRKPWWYPHWAENVYSHKISGNQYNALSPHLRKYFERYFGALLDRYKPNAPIQYYLKYGVFPLYELRYKVRKAYASHRGIPRSKEISEETKLNAKWDSNHGFWGNGNVWDKYFYKKRTRRKWTDYCKVVRKYLDGANFDENENFDSFDAQQQKYFGNKPAWW